MIRIRDIMTKDVIGVSPEMTLRDALNLLLTHRVRGAPVLNGSRVVGVVSTTDLLEFIAEPRSGLTRDEEEGSEGGQDWVEGETAPSAYFVDLWHQIDDDTNEGLRERKGQDGDLLALHTVSEAMTADICALPPETPVDAAARYMREQGIHRVLVEDGTELLGVVTTTDITNAVADQRVGTRSFVFNRVDAFDEREAWNALPRPDARDV